MTAGDARLPDADEVLAIGASQPMGRRLRANLTLERAGTRRGLAAALVIATLASPYLALPGGLPAIRLEQVLLVISLVPVLLLLARHPEFRRIGLVDAGFLLLAASMTMTIVIVPMILPGVGRSARDAFEVAWVAQYWLVYRIALTLEPPTLASRQLARLLGAAAIILGALAILQYLNPPGFNDTVTSIWTQAHNLLGVSREGRAVGTAGNANQLGILAVLLLFVALGGGLASEGRRSGWFWAAAAGASAIAVILAQSRGAILGMIVGFAAAGGLLLVRRGFRRAIVVGVPPLVVAAVLVVPLVLLAPPPSGSIARRLTFSGLATDPSVVVRVGRVTELVGSGDGTSGSTGNGTPSCAGSPAPDSSPSPGHEPGTTAPDAAPTSDAMTVATAVAAYYCKYDAWPTDLASALVPEFLPAVPGPGFGIYSSPRGFAVGLASSVTSPDEQPGAGTFPNLLANPSLEGPGGASPWHGTAGVTMTPRSDVAAFGSGATEATIPAGGSVYQLVVADLPQGTPYTVGMWIHALDGPVSPQLYVTAVTADGTTIDPLAVSQPATFAPDGWQHLAVSLRTPDSHLASLQVLVRGAAGPMHVLLDGASLTEGPFALPFGSLSDAAASSASVGPRLADSLILGVGPQKDEGSAVFDNEYASFLSHYGILGLVAYVLLFGIAFAVSLRAALRVPGWGGLLGVALAAFTLALGVFAVSAGAFRQLQVMLPFWMLVGAVSSIVAMPRSTTNPSTGDGT